MLGVSSWLQQTCEHYCSQSVYSTLYDYFGWSQFQSLPSRYLQELSQYLPKSVGSELLIGTGIILTSAAGLYYARKPSKPKELYSATREMKSHGLHDLKPKEVFNTNNLNGIKINIESSRGFHDSSLDFPLKDLSKYGHISSSMIELDFGHTVFALPENFMHYINDVESLGWSWMPPKEFLDCINQGYRKPDALQEIKRHEIGFLVSLNRFVKHKLIKGDSSSNGIFDSHGKDSNVVSGKATKVDVRDTVALDALTLERLEMINQFVELKFWKERNLKV